MSQDHDRDDAERVVSTIEQQWKPSTTKALTIYKAMNETQRSRVLAQNDPHLKVAIAIDLFHSAVINVRGATVNKKKFIDALKIIIDEWLEAPDYRKQRFIYALVDIPEVISGVTQQLSSGFYGDEYKEADEKDALGRVAFSPERLDLVPYEKNTKREDALFKDLNAHFHHKKKAITADDVEIISSFLKDEKYKKLFHKPAQRYVYRGMGVSEEWLKKTLDDDFDSEVHEGFIDKRFTFTPRNNGSSWTLDNSIAASFSTGENTDTHRVIMYALVDENPHKFVVCPGGLYNVIEFSNYESEREVIALGEINVHEISWIKKNN